VAPHSVALYLLGGFSGLGLGSPEFFGETFDDCAGAGEITGEAERLCGEVRTFCGGSAVGVGGLGSHRAQHVPALSDGGCELSGGSRCALCDPQHPVGLLPGGLAGAFEPLVDLCPAVPALDDR
jgi:hypothetical protein